MMKSTSLASFTAALAAAGADARLGRRRPVDHPVVRRPPSETWSTGRSDLRRTAVTTHVEVDRRTGAEVVRNMIVFVLPMRQMPVPFGAVTAMTGRRC